MVHHIVLVQFRDDIPAEERQSIWDELENLKHQVSGLESAVFGSNASPERFSRGYNDGFVMVFTDATARDQYLSHPAHKLAGDRLVAALKDGTNGLLVVDI